MKVAFLVAEFPSVSQTFIQNQIIGVIECGHDVTIFSRNERKNLKVNQEFTKYNLLERTIYLEIPKNKIIRLAMGLKFIARFITKNPGPILRTLDMVKYGNKAISLSLLYEIIALLESGPYDIIHCQFGDLGLHGLCLKQILAWPTKLVTSFRGYDASLYVHGKPGVYNELFQEGELFLPVSHSLKKRIIDQGCPEEKIVVLPSGIDCEKLTYSKRAVPQGESTRVLTIGRLVEKKGIAYAIEAIARVVASGRNVTYDVVGDGVLRGNLDRLIEERGMQDHIRLLGRKNHEEVIRLSQLAHIMIAPSITAADGDEEGIPNVLKEAMALGLPVISTTHSGIPELVEDGTSGFLVPERDAVALADRLSYLIDHPEKWENMGKAGRVCVETNYDKKVLNDQLLMLYRQLCQGDLIHCG